MIRCDSCGAETVFLSPQKDCLDCAQHDPLERAAMAIDDKYGMDGFGWEELTESHRQHDRSMAEVVLTAAVDVEELAEYIGPDHAQIVRDHLLGSAAP